MSLAKSNSIPALGRNRDSRVSRASGNLTFTSEQSLNQLYSNQHQHQLQDNPPAYETLIIITNDEES